MKLKEPKQFLIYIQFGFKRMKKNINSGILNQINTYIFFMIKKKPRAKEQKGKNKNKNKNFV